MAEGGFQYRNSRIDHPRRTGNGPRQTADSGDDRTDGGNPERRGEGPGPARPLLQAVQQFKTQVKAEQFDEAAASLRTVRNRLDSISPPRSGDDAGMMAEFRKTIAPAREALLRANETVDGQLNALRRKLLASDDPDLRQIAESGLNAITVDRRVGLMAAVMDLDSADASTKTARAEAARNAAVALRSFVETDERIATCDECPTLEITIRKTMSAALSGLEQALAAAA